MNWTKLKDTFRPPTMTLSFEDGLIRMVLFQGRQVVAWKTAYLPQEPSSEESDGISANEMYHAGLRSLLDEHTGRRYRVVTDIPLYASLLRHLELPDIPRRYLTEVIVSEVVDSIPFSEEEVEIKWRLRTGASDQKLFAIAVPRQVIEGHVKLLREAGAQPVATYSKAVALSLAAGTPDAIVVHLTSSQAAIVLVREGMPQVVNQLMLPGVGAHDPQQAEAVASAVEQMAGYYEGYQAFDAVGSSESLPVVLAGQLSDDGPLAQSLRQLMQREVLHCAPPLTYPEHFSPSEYMVNLGLALASQPAGKGQTIGQRESSISLLPEQYAPKPLPVVPVAVFAILLVLGAAAINVTTQVLQMESEVQDLSERVERLERLYTLGIKRAEGLHRKGLTKRDQVQELESRRAELRLDLKAQVELLETILDTAVPPSVKVPSVRPKGQKFTVTGTASDADDIPQYVENLRKSELFADVVIDEINGPCFTSPCSPGEGEDVEPLEFTLNVTMPSEPEEEEAEEEQ